MYGKAIYFRALTKAKAEGREAPTKSGFKTYEVLPVKKLSPW